MMNKERGVLSGANTSSCFAQADSRQTKTAAV